MERRTVLTLGNGDMGNRVELTANLIKELSDLPEHGMGYQIVDLEMKSGQVIGERTVVNSTFLILSEGENIDPSEISKITLHQRKSI